MTKNNLSPSEEQEIKYMCAAKGLKAWDPLDCQGFIKSDLLL